MKHALALLCLSLLLPLASRAKLPIPALDGVWVGTEEGRKGVATMRFEHDHLVVVDADEVLLGKVAFAGGGVHARKTWTIPVDATIERAFSVYGRVLELAADQRGRTSLGTMRLTGHAMRLCASNLGSPIRASVAPLASQPKEAQIRCFELTQWQARPALPPSSRAERFNGCVRACTRQNMMRAVGPDVIEADCRRECSTER